MDRTITDAVRRTTGPGFMIARMDRPERGNTIDAALLTGLLAALDDAEGDDGCRVFVLAATGTDFCAGMDLTDPAPEVSVREASATEEELPYWTLLRRLATGPLLTVALVDGAATAGGVGLAAACDLVLAGSQARFRLTEVLLGLLPAMALPFVARRTGEQQAFRLALTAAELDADAAVRIGLADQVATSAEDLLRPTLVSARRVDRGTTAALKRYRDDVFPSTRQAAVIAQRAFAERLADPAVARRMAELRLGGLLP